jgi:L-alanine-DL-glutamate epimerase-like enolase superfamily enzyme
LEGIQTWGGFHAQILTQSVCCEQGYLLPPAGPGLGIELNEEVAASHPYASKQLHLDMGDKPVV